MSAPPSSHSLRDAYGRRATWNHPFSPASDPRVGVVSELDDPAILEVSRRSSIDHPPLRHRTSAVGSNAVVSASYSGPPALIQELAKFDDQTSYDELRFVMELTAARASEGIVYPISSYSAHMSHSELPASDLVHKLSPAARRYLDEYNAGSHRLPPPVPVPASFVLAEQQHQPYFACYPGSPLDMFVPPCPDPSFGPSFSAYSPNGSVPPAIPIPTAMPLLAPFHPQQQELTIPHQVPTFEFQLDSSPASTDISQFSAYSDLLSTPRSSSFGLGLGPTSPLTTPATSPKTDDFSLEPYTRNQRPLTSAVDPLSDPVRIRNRKKSLVRLCAEEYARNVGAVKSWGLVKFFDGNKGWGFILDQFKVPGEDIWIHYTNLEIPKGHRFLISEELVEYLIVWDSKKSQLKALLVTGLGGTPLLAFSDPALAASLSKFKPSQGPLPTTLSPRSRKRIYAEKQERKRRIEDDDRKDKMLRFLQKEKDKERRELINEGRFGAVGTSIGTTGVGLGITAMMAAVELTEIEELNEEDEPVADNQVVEN
ncbi:cold-shock protein [Sporobolomyces koalae]|uniref:cold-shock protein n=1 Tax=Sporobolomyces koalae TaxID=500713 RepID=UPI0031765499